MLFMLRIDVTLPPEMAQAEKDRLRERENARALELIGEGVLLRIWRIVGRVANFSLWEAPTLEALHDKIGSMPMFPYMKIDVTPLINHPVTEAADARNGRPPRR
ncbi:MAG: muconolactone delta-isomerase [Betaproteobacteria bacterium]|nr:MAG: muconolactone delta-isomerase [Betaproteobacteria bacterium]